MTQVVAPQAGLRLERFGADQVVSRIVFLAVNKRRQPEARAAVGAPAIEMEVLVAASAARQRAIESNDRVLLIFNPDAANEAVLRVLARRSHVEHQATNIAKEFAADIIKFVVGLVESVLVQINHL